MSEPLSDDAQELLRRLKEKSEASRQSIGNVAALSFAAPRSSDLTPLAPVADELIDSTVVVLGMKVVLRGFGGCCVAVESDAPEKGKGRRFRGSACGQGSGEAHETLQLLNRHLRVAAGSNEIPVRYGDRINIRSHAAKDKFLAVPALPAQASAIPELTFERTVGMRADDWELLPAAIGPTDRAGFDTGGSERRRGNLLRAGDRIALRR